MALELFKPFIYNKLEERGYVTTIKSAKKMVEKERPEVWDILEEVIKEHPVLLNRAPTLHRLGIQAFEPVLIEGKAIQLHPLVCAAFNADFDGDQMAVHVPLSIEAQMEARVLMMSTNNILSPANGKPIIDPTQDIVLGFYYMTRERAAARTRRRARRFAASATEVRMAYDHGEVDLHAGDQGAASNGGSIGRRRPRSAASLLSRDRARRSSRSTTVNKRAGQEALGELIDVGYRTPRQEGDGAPRRPPAHARATQHATRGRHLDLHRRHGHPGRRRSASSTPRKTEVAEIDEQYQEGLITDGERYNKVVDIWADVAEQIAGEMMDETSARSALTDPDGERSSARRPSTPIYIMADSGARGSTQQIRQLAGMRGLMAKPSGEIIETPITTNFREGLSVLQYFISTHGARKGLADTALKTANSGYLTRRLVDVAQDAIITEFDCGTADGIAIGAARRGRRDHRALGDRILGRVALEDVVDPLTGEVLVPGERRDRRGTASGTIEDAGIEQVEIRSVLTCQTARGICVAVLRPRPRPRPRWSTSARRSASSPRSRSASPARSSRCGRSTSVAPATRRAEQSLLEARTEGTVQLPQRARR